MTEFGQLLAAVPTWAGDRLGKLPKRWAAKLEAEWRRHAGVSTHWSEGEAWKRAGADKWLVRRLEELEAGERAGIHPGMDDAALCKLAEAEARDHRDRQATIAGDWRAKAVDVPADMLAAAVLDEQKADALATMAGRGLDDLWPDGPDMTDAGRLARLRDDVFWRRVFRRVHARTVEACAIALGLVNGNADAYLSRESLRNQQQRQAANAAMLANTVAVGEYGQEMTLASVAERSVSNPTIRRGELMTRVAGFELCADHLGHCKRWAVLTCPSRMHKYTHIKGGPAVENKRYDGTKPRDAQQYLAGQWRKACAWWERQGLRVYGFRTTEPHQDGTPHWNLLAFFEPMTERVHLKKLCKLPRPAVEVFDEGLRLYFLHNEPENTPAMQRAAEVRRVRIMPIDASKGSAAAYIAKYISKGIDGHGIELDLFGNPIERASAAVVAWSRVWGIRQFQQIGGPPVTVWRELRKVNPDNLGSEAETAHTLREALGAVNVRLEDPEARQAAAWASYTTTQGGPTCKRKAWTVRMLRDQRQTLNRYGEAMAARHVGVWAVGRVAAPTPAHILAMNPRHVGGFTRPAVTAIESERGAWIVVSKGGVDDAIRDHCDRLAAQLAAMDAADQERARVRIERIKHHRAALRAVEGELSPEQERERAALAPWTRVNNCTATPTLDRLDRRHMDTGPASFGPLKVRRAKLGRWFDWNQDRAGGPNSHERAHT